MKESIQKYVNDLGIAAYIMLFGFQVIGKKGRSIYFKCDSTREVKEFDRLVLEYQPPNEFYTFDSCLMYLKKLNDQNPEEEVVRLDQEEEKIGSIRKVVSDLGVAAYIMMNEYKPKNICSKVVGKKGKYIFFEIPSNAREDFDKICYQYLSSNFQKYDSNLMALKKVNDFTPNN